ncbi:hypothetical protein K6119_11875 [Paracrocinitomix mangrovi]|uniref:hypothetical protein n=1 Tax=Paracrocinitomix mangrovi TaxID=2862509 RepID=UPI001C8E9D92|nr:hypothetical protein [Paracrocinitomix mangrovi]UKN00431.1 hypothetical protein K6119_11875 [Paracrocinitomix mangrovi]
MRFINYLSILLVSFLIVSCGNYQGFNRQKYTNFKKLKPVYNEGRTDEAQQSFSKEIQPKEIVDTVVVESQPDFEAEKIKTAIQDGKKVFVKANGKYYRIDNPVYDEVYKAVIGSSVEVSKEDLSGGRIVISAKEVKKEFQLAYVYRIDILSVMSDKVVAAQDNNHSNSQQVVRGNSPSKNRIQETEVNFLKSHYGRKTRSSGFVALAGIGTALFGILLLSAAGFGLSIVLFLLGYLITVISLMCMVVYARKYKLSAVRKNHIPFEGGKNYAILGWIGLVFLSILMLFLPLIITGILVAVQ